MHLHYVALSRTCYVTVIYSFYYGATLRQPNSPQSTHMISSDPMPLIEDNAKRNVSLRVDTTDYGKIKSIARRFRVRESEVFRFMIKLGLATLAPLFDHRARGKDVMPVFVEHGSEITKYFNLDAVSLERVINGDLDEPDGRVDGEDVGLLAMATMPERYLCAKLRELIAEPVASAKAAETLKNYLTGKYLGEGGP
ncbi:MAG: hypothetical protein ACREXM_05155 [Gammaproteobacteria bacterium]